MHFLPIFELILVLIGTFYVLRQYAAKDVPNYVKACCFISWSLSLAILVIVPLDVFYTFQDNNVASNARNPHQPSDSTLKLEASFTGMVSIWKIVYWTSFLFTWVILPLLQEYVAAGEFTVKDKIKRSLRVNLVGYAIMAGCGAVFVLYLQASNTVGKEGVMHFLITFSNCFGIALIILCLSFGLVYIPKRCFQQTRQRVNLKAHQYQAAMVEERKEKTEFELEDLVKNVEALLGRDDVKEEDKQHLRQILSLAPEQLVKDVREAMTTTTMANPGAYEKYSHKTIVTLHKKMKKKLNLSRRLEHKWEATVKRAFLLEDLLETNNPTEWRTRLSYGPSKFPSIENYTSALEYVWYQYLYRIIFFFIGLTFLGFSLAVFAAEMMTFSTNTHIFNLEKFIEAGDHAITRSQFLCLIPLAYILLCVYAALFNMRFAGRYGLYRHHQTDSSSLIFASLGFARVSSPLVVNFLQMVKIHGTAFEEVMGSAQLSSSFTKYFPLVLALLGLCTLVDGYGRILNSLGLKRYKFDHEHTNDKVEEGKLLLDKCRHSRSFNVAMRNRRKKSGFSDDATSANSNSPRLHPKDSNGYMLTSEARFSRGSLGSLDSV